MNPLSLSYYTVPELDPASAVAVAAEAGCAHVGLRLLSGQPNGEMLPIMTSAAIRAAMRKRLRDTGLTVLDANTVRLVPTTDVAAYRHFFEVAAELGARHALATADDPSETRLTENLAALCDLASQHGMTVQLEFVPWLAVASLVDAAELVARVDRSNLGIAIDALHFDRAGDTIADIGRVPVSRFAYMHVCDAPASRTRDRGALIHTAVRERLFPGEGAIDLVGLLGALPIGIPLALEIPTETLARTTPAIERVKRAVAATRRVVAATRQQETTP